MKVKPDRQDEYNRIIVAMSKGWMTNNDIGTNAGVVQIDKRLLELLTLGKVERRARGIYRLAPGVKPNKVSFAARLNSMFTGMIGK